MCNTRLCWLFFFFDCGEIVQLASKNCGKNYNLVEIFLGNAHCTFMFSIEIISGGSVTFVKMTYSVNFKAHFEVLKKIDFIYTVYGFYILMITKKNIYISMIFHMNPMTFVNFFFVMILFYDYRQNN